MTGPTGPAAALAAIAAGLVLTLGGCSSIPPSAPWVPREAVPTAVTVSAGEKGDSVPPAPEVSQTAVGLDARLLFDADPASPVGARWAEIPGNTTFTELVRGRVLTAVAEHSAATGVAYEPAADAPALTPEERGCVAGSTSRPVAELLADTAFTPAAGGAASLTVTCEILAGAGNVLVQALRLVTATGAEVTSDQTTVYYVETGGAFTTTSDTLITDDGLRSLLRDTVQSLKTAAGALRPELVQDVDESDPAALRATFSQFSFAPDGSLLVRLPAEFTVPELDALARPAPTASRLITVPAEIATPLLSEQGQQIQAVLASGAPLTLPPAGRRGDETVDCAVFACLAVTFDDGPGGFTGEVLDALAARRAAATFFVQGYRVEQNPQAVARADDEGHQIGNHSWNHPDLTKLTDEEVTAQLERTSAAVQAAIGTRPTTFRPPYGAVDQRVLEKTSLPAILWTVDTLDWTLPDDETLLQRAVAGAEPGDIVLLHDVHENTARMTPAILDGLLGRGFTLVTVEQLLGGTPAPHTTTRSG